MSYDVLQLYCEHPEASSVTYSHGLLLKIV